jgi:hypothetical protein
VREVLPKLPILSNNELLNLTNYELHHYIYNYRSQYPSVRNVTDEARNFLFIAQDMLFNRLNLINENNIQSDDESNVDDESNDELTELTELTEDDEFDEP